MTSGSSKKFRSFHTKSKVQGYKVWSGEKGWIVEFYNYKEGAITGDKYFVRYSLDMPAGKSLKAIPYGKCLPNHEIIAGMAKFIGRKLKNGTKHLTKEESE